ncbi:hypothetical protein H8B02_22825 [Bradyrhizobium sp. Pear77]|uniref:hypothetical protein n=1 Tax=Bradyrhizobium altum TaxID=1571202 RepID=UPI001E50C54A|nr:hypothetical protein [Bradyrhizobium altum]MCC8956158.1 hypothetical protein [Bradyrhizobium altum]
MLWKHSLESQVILAKKHLKAFEGKSTEFRQYSARQVDALKLLGGANAALLTSTALFLTSTAAPKVVFARLIAKLCFLIFAIGLAHFAYAYWRNYHWERTIDVILLDYRADEELNLNDSRISGAAEDSRPVGPATAISLLCLCLGGGVALVGFLLFV